MVETVIDWTVARRNDVGSIKTTNRSEGENKRTFFINNPVFRIEQYLQ